MQDEDYSDVDAGTMNQNPVNLKKAIQASSQSFGRPRIAAPTNIGNVQLGDHEIVVKFIRYSGFVPYCEIYGYNVYQGNGNSELINFQYPPTAGDLTGEYNSEPVVAYHREQEYIIVAWTYYDYYGKYGSYNTYDIIVRHLTFDGSLTVGPFSDPWYTILNYTELGTQKTPSIAQRFGFGGNEMLFVYDDYTNGLAYKKCQSESYVFRKKNPELNDIEDVSPFHYSMYPNPNSSGSLTIDLSTYDAQTKVLIFDSQGRKIINEKIVNESSVIELNGLSSGLYIIKLFANNQIYTEKISVIE